MRQWLNLSVELKEWNADRTTVTEDQATHSFLERYAHAVGVNRAELFCTPGFGLQWAVGMYLAAALLVFGIQRLNALYRDPHHGLVADFSRQRRVAHSGKVQVGLASVDPCIGWRGIVAKGFFETTDLRPPSERFGGVGGR